MSTNAADLQVGTLVRARGREWVVSAPQDDAGMLWLTPIGGADNEQVGLLPDLDPVESSSFPKPTADDIGDFVSGRLLRDAIRLGFRNSAGPFRSFGKISVEPRNYQMVPLLMALKLDPIRLLVGDDVGIGKTVEALLVAIEALTTGTAERLAVLCPPHLAEQWAEEMRSKFHLDPTLVLSSTAPRLERGLEHGESLFERHPITVVSTDFIKTERRRDEFVRAAPDMVVVDEAHTVAVDLAGRSAASHQRHDLVRRLAADQTRHLVLVTATPHTGNEAAFQSLLGLLNPSLETLDPDRPYSQAERDTIAEHFVQRKRSDIRQYVGEDTPFPDRHELGSEDGTDHGRYVLDNDYRLFVDRVRRWAAGTLNPEGTSGRDRLRYWSVLGLLRQVASSPRAAASTLRNRSVSRPDDPAAEVDAEQREALLDHDSVDPSSGTADATVGIVTDESDTDVLERLAAEAEALEGPDSDAKLRHVEALCRRLLDDGFNPIVFCRFIDTAEYVAEHLTGVFGDGITVEAVTGRLPSDQREAAVAGMAGDGQRVLVATDCLSEGINLQELFSAAVHYDLPWNPTRLEQREGRVDRYGQPADEVRVATIHSDDTLIDPLVMNVLLRKHRTIKSNLGVSIPVPGSTNELLERASSMLLEGIAVDAPVPTLADEAARIDKADALAGLFKDWENVSAQEKRSRTVFAQESVKVEEVAAQVEQVQQAIGRGVDVRRFLHRAVQRLGGTVDEGGMTDEGPATLGLGSVPTAIKSALDAAVGQPLDDYLKVRYEKPVQPDEMLLTRTHPLVATLAAHLLDAALDQHATAVVSRAAVVETDAVPRPTVLMLLRHRYDLTVNRASEHREERSLLVEDQTVVGYQPDTSDAGYRWLDTDEAEQILDVVTPTGNLDQSTKTMLFDTFTDSDRFGMVDVRLGEHLQAAADRVLASHRAVRAQSGGGMGRSDIAAKPPVDVLGVFVLRNAAEARQ